MHVNLSNDDDTLFGMPIVLDESVAPGEIRIFNPASRYWITSMSHSAIQDAIDAEIRAIIAEMFGDSEGATR